MWYYWWVEPLNTVLNIILYYITSYYIIIFYIILVCIIILLLYYITCGIIGGCGLFSHQNACFISQATANPSNSPIRAVWLSLPAVAAGSGAVEWRERTS